MDTSTSKLRDEIVCVTGATGFVASHIIKILLEDGYIVRGTVRSASETKKFQYLLDLDKIGNRLTFYSANLTEDGSFDQAVNGAHFVLHTASPYTVDVKDPQKELVEPAVQGTLTVLKSCSKSSSVKRVVVTSSMAAITDSPENDHIYTEADWNTTSTLTRNPYYYSKRLAEEAAWKYVQDNSPKFSVVVINPFVVIGPEMNPESVNPSNKIIMDIMTGRFPGIINLGWGLVDVRDVALSHVLAIQKENAKGRYLCCNLSLMMKEVVPVLQAKYPGYHYPKVNLACGVGDTIVKVSSHFQGGGVGSYLRTNVGRLMHFDNTKIKQDLGMTYMDINQSIYDTIDTMIKNGHLAAPKN